MNRFIGLLLVLLSMMFLSGVALAQEPIIEETTPPPVVPLKPKPKPRPTFVRPRLLWRTQVGRVDGTPLLKGDELYIGANGNLVALDTEGHIQWTTEVGSVPSAPVANEKLVFVATGRGIVYAVERATGTVVWKFLTDGNAGALTTPVLTADRLIFEATDNNVYALTPQNGQLRWKITRPDGSLGYGSPTFDDGSIFVSGETTLYDLDPGNGKINWKAFIGGKSLSTPAADADRVYAGGDGTGMTALQRRDGSTAWTFQGKSEGDWFGPPLLASGTVYCSTYRRFVYALEAATGRFKWSERVPGSALTQPALDAKRNVLYVPSATFGDNPSLTAFDARTGRKLWDFSLGYIGGSPVIAGDRLYVGSANGYLYAFSLR